MLNSINGIWAPAYHNNLFLGDVLLLWKLNSLNIRIYHWLWDLIELKMKDDINKLKQTHPHIYIVVKGYCVWLILYVLFQHLRLSKVRQSRQLPNSRPLNNLPSRVEITREILRELEWNNSWFSFYENIFHTLRAYIYLTVCDRTANKRLTNITYIQLISWKKFFSLVKLIFRCLSLFCIL